MTNWNQPELEIVNRFARDLAAGKYRSAGEATPDCARELDALRLVNPSIPRRSPLTVRTGLGKQCKALGLGYALSFWSPDELRLAKHYVEEFLAGRFPTMRHAARACQQKLADELGRKRTVEGTCWHMARAIRAKGVPAREQEWTKADLKVLNRHVRMLHCGRQWTLTDMTRECSRALDGRHSPMAVRSRVKPMLRQTGLPRFHGFSEPFERELIEQYARKAAAGELSSWHAAGVACHRELEAEYVRRARSAPGGASRDYGRPAERTCRELVHVANKLGLRTTRDQHRWSEEENRMYESWLRWYKGHKRNRRNSPLTQAALGLQDDLAEKGFRRSLDACRNRLGEYVVTWRLVHGR
jgi:hypothetical protein